MSDFIISTQTTPFTSATVGDLVICNRDTSKSVQIGCGISNSASLIAMANSVKVYGNLDVSGKVNQASIINGHITCQSVTSISGNASFKSLYVEGHCIFGDGKFIIPTANIVSHHLAPRSVKSDAIDESNVLSRHIASSNIQRHHIESQAIAYEQIDNNSIGRDHLRPRCVGTEKIADLAVTVDKLSTELRIPALNIGDGAVVTDKLADGAVTASKIAERTVVSENLGNDSVVARVIATSGVVTRCIADGNVTTEKVADGAVTADKIADANVTTAKLNDRSITTAKVAAQNITEELLADQNVTTPKIRDLSVTEGKLADESVTTGKLANGAVQTENVLDLSITTNKLADAAVATPKIAESSVTESKLATGSVTTDKIAQGTITDSKMAALTLSSKSLASACIETDKLAVASVTTPKLSDEAVTTDKIAPQNVTESRLGNDSVVTRVIKDDAVVTSKISNKNVTTEKIALSNITSDLLADSLSIPGNVTLKDKWVQLGDDHIMFVDDHALASYSSVTTPKFNHVIQIETEDRALFSSKTTELRGAVGIASSLGSSLSMSETLNVNTPNLSSKLFGDAAIPRPLYVEFGNASGFATESTHYLSSAHLEIRYNNIYNIVYSGTQGQLSYITMFLYDHTIPNPSAPLDRDFGGIHICIYTSGRVVVYNKGVKVSDTLCTRVTGLPTCLIKAAVHWQKREVQLYVGADEVLKFNDSSLVGPIGKIFGCYFSSTSNDPRLHALTSYALTGRKLYVLVNGDADTDTMVQSLNLCDKMYINSVQMFNKDRELSNVTTAFVRDECTVYDNVFGASNELRGRVSAVHSPISFHNTMTASNASFFEREVKINSVNGPYTVFGDGSGSNMVYDTTVFKGALDSSNNAVFRGERTEFLRRVVSKDVFEASNIEASNVAINGDVSVKDSVVFSSNNIAWKVYGSESQFGLRLVDPSKSVVTERNSVVMSFDTAQGNATFKNKVVISSISSESHGITLFNPPPQSDNIGGIASFRKIAFRGLSPGGTDRFVHDTADGTTTIAGLTKTTSLKCTAAISTRTQLDPVTDVDTFFGSPLNRIVGDTEIKGLSTVTGTLNVTSNVTFGQTLKVDGVSTLSNSVTVYGTASFASNANFSNVSIKTTSFGDSNVINGNTWLMGAFTSNNGILYVSGSVRCIPATSTGPVLNPTTDTHTYFGTLKNNILGDTEIKGCSTITGPLLVDGVSTLSNNVFVYGNASFSSNTTFSNIKIKTTTFADSNVINGDTWLMGSFTSNNGDLYVRGSELVNGDIEVAGDTYVRDIVVKRKCFMGTDKDQGVQFTTNSVTHFTNPSGQFNIAKIDPLTYDVTNIVNIRMDTNVFSCSNMAASNVNAYSVTGESGLTVRSVAAVNDVNVRLSPNNGGRTISVYSKGGGASEFGICDDVGTNTNWLRVTYSGGKPMADIRGDINLTGAGSIKINNTTVVSSDRTLQNITDIELNRVLYKTVYHGRIPMHITQTQPQPTSTILLTILKWNAADFTSSFTYGNGKMTNMLTSSAFASGGTEFNVPAPGIWFIRAFIKFDNPYVNGELRIFKNESTTTIPADKSKIVAREFIPSGSGMASVFAYTYLAVNDRISINLSTTDLCLGNYSITTAESFLDLTLLYPHS